jgi:hypothetical protein
MISAVVGTVSAQSVRGAPAKIDGYTAFAQRACAWSEYAAGSDWRFGAAGGDNAVACAALCDNNVD